MAAMQIIYYGAPGTGKSYAVESYLKNENISLDKIFRTTFHPEYTYSDFVGQILPVVKEQSITYDFVPGVFTEALKEAYSDTSKNIYLVIEEMSRGNVASIFGDIFQLLDRNDKGNSRYPIRNTVIAKEIIQLDNDVVTISLPANFNIIGTVNTSDQNVFVMDTAFKRRFDWKYISTDPVKDSDGNLFEKDNVKFELISNSNGSVTVDWHSFYMKLNRFITDRHQGLGLSEDKQIGQFFIQFSINMSDEEVVDKFQNKLLQYLWSDIESNSYISNGNRTLFNQEITSYAELYHRFINKEQIFSDVFIEYYKA